MSSEGSSPLHRLKARVHVFPRAEILDPQGKAIKDALGRLGFDDVADVRAGKVFSMEVAATDEDAAHEQLKQMCEGLLANTVTEDYSVEILAEADAGAGAGQ